MLIRHICRVSCRDRCHYTVKVWHSLTASLFPQPFCTAPTIQEVQGGRFPLRSKDVVERINHMVMKDTPNHCCFFILLTRDTEKVLSLSSFSFFCLFVFDFLYWSYLLIAKLTACHKEIRKGSSFLAS